MSEYRITADTKLAEIGPILRAGRKRDGRNLAVMSCVVGISDRILSGIEQGQRFPSFPVMFKLCSEYGIELVNYPTALTGKVKTPDVQWKEGAGIVVIPRDESGKPQCPVGGTIERATVDSIVGQCVTLNIRVVIDLTEEN